MKNQAKDKPESNIAPGMAFPHSPFVPYDPKVDLYLCNLYPFAIPWEYTGWRDETMSWKETCYLHGNLNPTPTFRIGGPEAVKFLSDICVNTLKNFPIGTGKHGIMCTEEGFIMQDGVMIRVGEDDFITYWMAPYIAYALMKGRYDAMGEDLTGKVFLFQIAGPRSLEVLEAASGDDLHDIKFMHHRMTNINGMEVRVLRMGMAGTLAYEVHGQIGDALPIYNAILKAGEPFGIRRLGHHAYMMNHTEDGFPQAYYHFPYPWFEDKDFSEFLKKMGGIQASRQNIRGSIGPDVRLCYRNPVELGWAGMIKFDHDFVGRKALEKEVANPRRKMVTLVWNTKDIIDVYASQFQPGEPYPNMDEPNNFPTEHGENTYHVDQVLKNGKLVGISSGRAYSYYYREMLSLCSIDVKHSAIGTEVIVLWGDPGTRQKKIRAKVARFPYLNENRNQVVDVSKIPHPAK
jgi:glycine cleavage system aminomethyltransferase T